LKFWNLSTSLLTTHYSFYACDVFFKTNPFPHDFSIGLNGLRVIANPAPATSHFRDVNLLGADFCALNNVEVVVNYKSKEAKLVFLDHQLTNV
jgi:hypothetical protein